MGSIVAVSGSGLAFPSWGRSFWQDPNDGQLICLYASGAQEVNYITSSDSGNTWSTPQFAFPVDDFGTHYNFDTSMDRAGQVHCVHRYNGSGCYTVLGRVAGSGWIPSGVIARGFFACRTTTVARDFNGSIEVYDKSKAGLDGFPTITGINARIAAVDSSNNVKAWYVPAEVAGAPYSGFPILQGTVSTLNVGPSGGYPIMTDGGNFDSLGVPFSVNATGVQFRQTAFSDGFWVDNTNSPLNPQPVDPGVPESNQNKIEGWIGDVGLGPNMAWCRSYIGIIHPILTTVGTSGAFELWTTASEPLEIGHFFGRVDSFAETSGLGPRRLIPDDLPFKQFTNNLAGAALEVDGGVPVDVAYYDEPLALNGTDVIRSALNFYFLQRRLNGDQTIFRIKAVVENRYGGNLNSKTRFTFSDTTNPASGVISWADVNIANAGAGSSGLPNVVHWHGFKALKSPVQPGSGVTTPEVLVTIGKGVTNGTPHGESTLYAWRFDDSLAATNTSLLSTFATEHTADSGNTFIGIKSASGITSPSNLFDSNTSTSGAIANSGTIALEFSKILTFNRLEVLWNSPPSTFWGIDVESSLDDVTYYTVLNIPSGTPGASPSLVKSSAEYDVSAPVDPTVTADMDGFAAKYVKLTFLGDDATSRDVREIKLYGAHSTKGFISTSEWNSQVVNRYTENFASTTLPDGWRTYGDFNWFIDKGIHQSGLLFTGDTIGSGDLTAIRTQRNSPINSTGVLEVAIDAQTPRDISFALKWAFQGNVASFMDPNDPADDYLFLYILTPTGVIDVTNAMYTPALVNPWGYTDVNFNITSQIVPATGIRWVYKRGNKEAGAGPGGTEAAVWIDNIEGLDPGEGPNLNTSLWAYMEGAPFPVSGNFNAYTNGVEVSSGVVYSYLNPFFEQANTNSHGYLLGEVGATGVVYGYAAAVREFGDVYGYMEGFIDTPSQTVNAYMFTSGAFDMLYGHMQNKINESINGFMLAPSGAFESINAYIATPQFMAVNGYLNAGGEQPIQVNAYLKANGFGDQVNGYMFASGLTHQSYGYMNTDGAAQTSYGYMRSTQQVQVNAFMQGHEAISGVINSWISGIAAVSDSINGFIPAISGSLSGNFNGYIGGFGLPNGNINAHIIGFGGSGQCNFPVPNPGFVTSPTGNFFN